MSTAWRQKDFISPLKSPAASPGKKRRDDDHSIFPTVAGAAKGHCFLLQPRRTDNRGEVISDSGSVAETRRKLAPPSRFASRCTIARTEPTRKLATTTGSAENLQRQDPVAAPRIAQNVSTCRAESKMPGDCAASQNRRDDPDVNDVAAARVLLGTAGLWDRDTVDLIESELRDELNYRLMLHRLEVRDSP